MASDKVEPDETLRDARLGAYVRSLCERLQDSPKSFLYQVTQAIALQDAESKPKEQ